MLAPLLTRFQLITDKFYQKRSVMVSRVAVLCLVHFFDGISPLDPNLGAREPQLMFSVSRPHLEIMTFYL